MVAPAIHDDVIKWKHFPRHWPFVRGIHRSPVNSPHKSHWHGALMFSLICTRNKRLSKQSWGWWLEMPSCSLWRHCNEICLQAFPVANGFNKCLYYCHFSNSSADISLYCDNISIVTDLIRLLWTFRWWSTDWEFPEDLQDLRLWFTRSRHQMKTFSMLLALCEGNPPVTGGFPSQGTVARSFDVFRDLCLNKRLSKRAGQHGYEMPLHSLWCQCNEGATVI